MGFPTKVFKKGEIVTKEGHLPKEEERCMYYILEGELEVFAKNPHRNQKNLVNTLKKGDLIGELSFFESQPTTATLIALTDTKVMVIKMDLFKGIKPEYVKIFQAMAKKIRKLNAIILERS